MSTTFKIKKGDTLPILDATLSDADGVVIDLSSATEVLAQFTRRLDGDGAIVTGETMVERDATIEAPATGGRVTYQFDITDDWTAPGDLDAGTYDLEFQVTFSGGDVLTVPTVRYLTLVIYEDLD